MYQPSDKSKSKGFTIIELIIALFIMSVGIIGVFNVFSVMSILTSDTTDKLVATYLAQEGMEITRNIRDTNWLVMDTCTGAGCQYTWVDGLTMGSVQVPRECSGVDGCNAVYSSTSMLSGKGYLNINSNGFYDYSACDASDPRYATDQNYCETKFKRKIIISPLKDLDGNSDVRHIIKVKALVSWDQKATLLNKAILAEHCCPYDDGCSQNFPNISNCVSAEETLYDWYNAPSSNNEIIEFVLYAANGDAITDEDVQISQTGSITINLSHGESCDSRAAYFVTTGSSVSALDNNGNPIVQTSVTSYDVGTQDTNVHDFSAENTYKVTAQDGTTKIYSVFCNTLQ